MTRLEQRANLLRQLRKFFDNRNFVEVETPLLSPEIIPEQHIEPIAVASPDSIAPPEPTPNSRDAMHRRSQTYWLQSSPEAHMKRLLATTDLQSIYQVTRSFRAGERGNLHLPEFTIVEWYRIGDNMQRGIALLDELCQHLLGTAPAIHTSYAEAFDRHVGLCPHSSTADQLAGRATKLGIAIPVGLPVDDRDQWLNLLLATQVEPQLGNGPPEILYDYPASQAALAKTRTDRSGITVAERFEIYWQGIELANGYHELTDAKELRNRFNAVNIARESDGRHALPLPEQLLAAMTTGLPACAGCALGFDRLVMLALKAKSITEVVAFSNG